MSIALGTRMNVGDSLEFEGKKGKIKQIGLTKTIIELDESSKIMMIPNKKIDEEIAIIQKNHPKKQSTGWEQSKSFT